MTGIGLTFHQPECRLRARLSRWRLSGFEQFHRGNLYVQLAAVRARQQLESMLTLAAMN